MARLKAQVLAPGERLVPTANGRRRVTFTPEYVRAQVERNNAMLAAKIPVPASWEHRSDAKPGSSSPDDMASARAKGVAGHVEQYTLEDGKAFVVLDIPDEADSKQAKTVRFVSPRIDRFVDGNGKDWGEVFTHVAITPKPVQHEQPAMIELGFGYPIQLSIDPYTGADMDENEEKPADVEKKDEPKPEEKKEEKKPDASQMAQALTLLAGRGIVLPDDTTPDNVWERIITAATALTAVEPPDLNNPANVVETKESSPISMSLDKLRKQADSFVRTGYRERLARLVGTGRITPVLSRKIATEVGAVQLSFDDAGELNPNSVGAKIEAYEALEANTAWSPTGKRLDLSHAKEVEPPVETPSDEKTLKDWDAT